ncbi:Rossmann-like and DUF2520 domain-containing protein [Sphingobium cloacae]|uniref:Cytoplasmic protein n=1 Tax=Sphingobium cloacae TaxID=120107 RepID=A0A1E1F6Q8_9SPHN|nr:DUF2520 domain-containing protein [Sphingobium cloacae]BAV66194.1 hypothetical protein SCLO_1031540 [Sphingobium cloacae]
MTGAFPRCKQLGIIGAGRAGQAFAVALAPFSEGAPLLFNRSPRRLGEALARLPRARAVERAAEIWRRCDLIVMAVADDSMNEMAKGLSFGRPGMGRPFLFHLSGRCGVGVLEPLRQAGAVTAAVHPVMTFTGDPANEARRMAGAPFGVTGGSAEAVERAMAVVKALGGKGFVIAEEMRALYHGALSHAANHLVTLMEGAARALEAAGVADPHGVLGPLARAAMENSLADGFAALSGPLLRGDRGTIGDHLEAFRQRCPAVLPDYRAMALATLREMERHGMGQGDAVPDMRRLLEDGGSLP